MNIDFSNPVMKWWLMMCGITLFNFILLFLLRRKLQSNIPKLTDYIVKSRNLQFVMAAVYTLVCGFRSVFPRGDVLRFTLWDNFISSIAIGRSAATIAETLFIVQWIILLREIHNYTKDKFVLGVSKVLFPIVIIAEMFSWGACTTTNYFWTMIEQSCWVLMAVLFFLAVLKSFAYYKPNTGQRYYLIAAIVSLILYIGYMVFVDIASYYHSWQASLQEGRVFSTIAEGFREVVFERNATQEYEVWRYSMLWMALYFSLAVWMSMIHVIAPPMNEGRRAQ